MKTLNGISVSMIMAALLTGCAGTSLKKHDEKYADISLEQLLDAKKLPADQKAEMHASLVNRAMADETKGLHKSAVKHATLALNLVPDDPEAQLWLAYGNLGQGHLEKAKSGFSQLANTAPSALVNQGLGLTLLAQNKPQEAQIQLNEAVALDSNLWRSWNGLGVIYDMSESWRLAEQAFKAGIAVAQHNTTLNNNLGLSYLRQKRLQEAIIAFENVQALPGGKSVSDLNFRTALALNGEMSRALGGTTDTEKAQLYNNLGVIKLDDGDVRDAIQFLKKAIATSPSYYPQAEKNLEIAKSALS
ncbi:MAG: tetratricopeptide repeat protein [Hyphomonadaceae bacterium]|nr:tetratricopeptide repeat protein [Hyphomonadaceae bacterium]